MNAALRYALLLPQPPREAVFFSEQGTISDLIIFKVRDRQTGRQTDRQAGTQTDRQTLRQTLRQTETQTDTHTGMQADRQTGRQVEQTGMQAGRQTHTRETDRAGSPSIPRVSRRWAVGEARQRRHSSIFGHAPSGHRLSMIRGSPPPVPGGCLTRPSISGHLTSTPPPPPPPPPSRRGAGR